MTGTLLLIAAVARGATTDTGPTTPPVSTGDTGVPPVETGETGDTGATDTGLDLDRDGDGYSPRQGDCDDEQDRARPGLAEACFDQLDNDCDGLWDEECDDSARLATLEGGGGCTGGSNVAGTTALLLLLPLPLSLARRSRA